MKKEQDIIEQLSKLSPEALQVVATVLEHRANSAVQAISILPFKAEIARAYALFSNMADQALQLRDDREQEDALEARLIAGEKA